MRFLVLLFSIKVTIFEVQRQGQWFLDKPYVISFLPYLKNSNHTRRQSPCKQSCKKSMYRVDTPKLESGCQTRKKRDSVIYFQETNVLVIRHLLRRLYFLFLSRYFRAWGDHVGSRRETFTRPISASQTASKRFLLPKTTSNAYSPWEGLHHKSKSCLILTNDSMRFYILVKVSKILFSAEMSFCALIYCNYSSYSLEMFAEIVDKWGPQDGFIDGFANILVKFVLGMSWNCKI